MPTGYDGLQDTRPSMPEEAFTVLSVSGQDEDHRVLSDISRQSDWCLRHAASLSEALDELGAEPVEVVICDRDLPDGSWKTLLAALALVGTPPALVVSSRVADDYLWAEVLNLGGCDVLAKPFGAREVLWSVSMAFNHQQTSSRQLEHALV